MVEVEVEVILGFEVKVESEVEVELKLDVKVGDDELDSEVEVEAKLEVAVGAAGASFFPSAASLCCSLNLALRVMLSDFCWTFLNLATWLCAKPVQHDTLLDTIQRRSCKMSGMIWSCNALWRFRHAGRQEAEGTYVVRIMCSIRSIAGTPAPSADRVTVTKSRSCSVVFVWSD